MKRNLSGRRSETANRQASIKHHHTFVINVHISVFAVCRSSVKLTRTPSGHHCNCGVPDVVKFPSKFHFWCFRFGQRYYWYMREYFEGRVRVLEDAELSQV